ncbi:hypothetical protein Nmel_018161, partial [Mimus melanotis]
FDKNLQDLVRGIRNHKEDELSALCTAGFRLLQTHQDEHCAASHSLLILFCAQLFCHGFGEVTCEEHV